MIVNDSRSKHISPNVGERSGKCICSKLPASRAGPPQVSVLLAHGARISPGADRSASVGFPLSRLYVSFGVSVLWRQQCWLFPAMQWRVDGERSVKVYRAKWMVTKYLLKDQAHKIVQTLCREERCCQEESGNSSRALQAATPVQRNASSSEGRRQWCVKATVSKTGSDVAL